MLKIIENNLFYFHKFVFNRLWQKQQVDANQVRNKNSFKNDFLYFWICS